MTDGSADVSRRGFLTAAAGATATAAAAGSAAGQNNTTAGGNQTSGGNASTDSNGTAGGNETASGNETAGGNETDGGGGGGGGGGEPDFGGYLDDANGFDGVEDLRGESEPTVSVGAGSEGVAFAPAAIHVDNGATVVWEWTGEGGSHNVVHQDGDFESDLTGEEGFTFEQTFEEDGIYNYYCNPHRDQGMLGSVVVGSDYPTVDTGGEGGGPQELPGAAMTLAVATSLVMTATLGLAYVFLKFGGSTPE